MGAYYGDPGINSGFNGDISLLESQNRNRALQDDESRARMNQDLSIRRDRLRALYDPLTGMPRTTNNLVSQGLTPANPEVNTVLKEDLSPQDKMKFGLERNAQELDKQKINNQAKFGEERLGIQQQQADINSQKSQSIHDTKMADMQRKADEADKKLQLAHDQLSQKTNDANSQLQFHQAQLDATNARHALDLAQRDKALDDIKNLHKAQIDDLNAKIEELTHPKTTTETTELDASGNKKVVTKQKGNNQPSNDSTTIKMTGKDGKPYNVPSNKRDQAIKDGFSEIK